MHEEYAKALIELVEKKPKEEERILKDFIALLKQRGHIKLLPKILKSIEKLSEKQEADSVELILAKEKDKEKHLKKAQNYKEHFKILGDVKTKVDDTIIGGFIIKTKQTIVDGSYKKYLMELYNKFSN